MISSQVEILRAKYTRRENELLRPAKALIMDAICRVVAGCGLPARWPTCRIKDPDKFLEKALFRKKNYKDPFREITDQLGFRIVMYFAEDVEQMRDVLLDHLVMMGPLELQEIVDKRLENAGDESAGYAKVGYGSLHLILLAKPGQLPHNRDLPSQPEIKEPVSFEIQIRSILQDAWADVEHSLNYKTDLGMPNSMRRRLYVLAGMLELADREFDDIRVSRGRLKAERIEAISQKNYAIGLSPESLQRYAQVSPVTGALLLLNEVFPVNPWSTFDIFDWTYILRSASRSRILTIQQLDTMLQEVLLSGKAKLFVDALHAINQAADLQNESPPIMRSDFREELIVWLFMAKFPARLLSDKASPSEILSDAMHNAIVSAGRDVFPDSYVLTEDRMKAQSD